MYPHEKINSNFLSGIQNTRYNIDEKTDKAF